jgi:hypothetical protein
MPHVTTFRARLLRLPRRALALPIHAYRLVISPLLGPRCRFQPTCSAYALEALERHGAVRGSFLAVRRLLRCHPIRQLGGGSGYDPVPDPARPSATQNRSRGGPQMVHKTPANRADTPNPAMDP